jgi:energy-coupling factor transport system ATP-binding protein
MGGRVIALHALGCRYAGHETDALADVSADLPAGGSTLLSGPTGSGKSTLAAVLCGVIPHLVPAALRGRVAVGGQDPAKAPIRETARTVGLLLQNVEWQTFTDDPEDEVAFGLENRAVPPAEIGPRAAEVLAAVGAAHLAGRRLDTLSTGERQRVVLAALLALRPPVLVLDEPLAYLDRAGVRSLLAQLADLGRAGHTVLVLEHRRDLVRRSAGRELFLDGGRLADAPPPRDGFPAVAAGVPGPTRLAWQRVSLTRGRLGPLLDDVSVGVRGGESVVLAGDNGSGKTTMLKAALGLVRPAAGSVVTCGRDAATTSTRKLATDAALVLQNPDHQLHLPTVAEEVGYAGGPDRAAREIARLGLTGLEGRHPQSLSVGQKRRVTLAAALARDPKLLLLDEPTVGQDDASLARVLARLAEYVAWGGALVAATHDRRAALALGTRPVLVDRGTARPVSRRDLELYFTPPEAP